MNEQNIAVVGYPNCGKTVLLSVLCSQNNYQPLTAATHNFMSNSRKIARGEWPEKTDPSTKAAELSWRVSKNGENIVLHSMDFAGELWDEFIQSYGDYRKIDANNDELNGICSFLLSAAAIVVCVDLSSLFDAEDYRQKWVVQAIRNFLVNNGHSERRMAVLLTKYDKGRDLVEQEGGLDAVLQREFSQDVNAALRGRFFPIAAVRTEYSDDNVEIPRLSTAPTGIAEFEEWLFDRVKRVSRAKNAKRAGCWRALWITPLVLIVVGSVSAMPNVQWLVIVGVVCLGILLSSESK